MAATPFSPIVYWGQNLQTLSLNVALRDVKDPVVVLDEDHLEVRAEGTGGQGFHKYEFQIEFYLTVDPKKSKYRVKETGIEFSLKKQGRDCWPRLTYGCTKLPWLKIDFDNFEYDDSEKEIETDPEDEKLRREYLDNLEKQIIDTKKSAIHDIRKAYLFLYNMFQWVGYCFIFISIMIRYVKNGEDSKAETYERVGSQMMFCQFLAFMEVVHPLLKLVKSGVLQTFMQVFGRNLVLFILIANNEDIQKHNIIWWLFTVWSAIEVVRYPFYMLSSLHKDFGLVTWLRYTVWIPLYPMGFMFEGYILMRSVRYFDQNQKFSLSLPNRFNMSFSFPTFLTIYMFSMLPAFYLLMMHMYKLRKNKLMPHLRKKKPATGGRKGPMIFRTKIQ